ncbi:hypothetical protein TNCV_3547321 [Trichonephila clavipes]|nr:hypothetical protein TNCV_3547321 [Trichonephila clavipes]
MVWAGIMINDRKRLHVVANGTMTGQRYIDEVLLPHVRLFPCCYLNPIENVWDALGRLVAVRNCPPTNKNTLIRALTEEWDKLPQQLLDNVVQSVAFSTIQVTVQFVSVPPNFEGELPGGDQRPLTSLPLSPTSREDLQLDEYLKCPQNRHYMVSMLSSGFEPRPYGTVVGATYRCA